MLLFADYWYNKVWCIFVLSMTIVPYHVTFYQRENDHITVFYMNVSFIGVVNVYLIYTYELENILRVKYCWNKSCNYLLSWHKLITIFHIFKRSYIERNDFDNEIGESYYLKMGRKYHVRNDTYFSNPVCS